MYYLRTKAAADAIKFTLDVEAMLKTAGDINTRSMSKTFKEEKNDTAKEDVNFKEYLQKKKVKFECTDEICTSCGS
jgi:ribonucleoside-diphosphate reductase subunit M1